MFKWPTKRTPMIFALCLTAALCVSVPLGAAPAVADVAQLTDNLGKYFQALGRSGGQTVVTPPTTWQVNHVPAVNVIATALKAAPSLTREKHVVTEIGFGLTANATGNAEDGLIFNLVQDAAGTPSTLRSWRLSMPAGAAAAGTHINITGLHIAVAAGKSVTLATATQPATNTYAYVNLGGYTLPR